MTFRSGWFPQMLRPVLCLLMFFLASEARAQRVLYVDADAAGAGGGTSWADAFSLLQDALAAAVAGDEVWVAEGVYTPHMPANPSDVTDADRGVSFVLRNGVALYGGFTGTETRREDRDAAAHPTALSGDLLGNDTDILDIDEPSRQDNSWHVVEAGSLDQGPADATAVLDGFVVTGGNANAEFPNPNNLGGGLSISGTEFVLSRPTLRRLVVTANTARSGGGLGATFGAPTLTDVTFSRNTADDDGGGMYTFSSQAVLRNVSFRDNAAGNNGGGLFNNRGQAGLVGVTFLRNRAVRGGGAYNLDDNAVLMNVAFLGNEAVVSGGGLVAFGHTTGCPNCPQLFNVVFSGNRTTGAGPDARGGGALYTFDADPNLTNVTFSHNTTAKNGGALYNLSSNPTLINAILWGNRADSSGHQVYDNNRVTTSRIAALHTLIEGGLPPGAVNGGNNRSADPLWTNPLGFDGEAGTEDDDLSLQPGSPAIDAGRNDAVYFDPYDLDGDGDTGERFPADLFGRTRVFAGLGGAAVVDLGALEFGAPPLGVLVALEEPTRALPEAAFDLHAYPNPFRDRATMQYALPAPARVVLTVYDALGRTVATLVDAVEPAGDHAVHFDASSLPSGLYLYQLRVDGRVVTKTVLRVR